MTEPEPLMSVECRCLCNCANSGVGPGCCARNAEGGMPEIGATTCICHRCLEEGPPPQPHPQEEKELRLAAVVRVVHPCELDNCSCQRTTLPFVWVPGEEKPRCFECLKPVQEFSRLESLDRAAAHWDCFMWVSWTSCSSMIPHECGREAFAVGSQTVTTRGVIRLVW